MKATVKDPTAVSQDQDPGWLNRTGVAAGLLGLLCLLLFFYQLGSYPLFDVDEPRYAEAAREMLESGDWITPYFNYELRFDKPVLHYWLIALSYQVFGVNEFAARLVSALAATGTVFAVFALGRAMVSTRYGLFAGLILATSVEVIGLSRMSITDMTLTFFMSATTVCLLLVAERSVRWWLAAGLFSGLAILTKGPVGIVVPGAILVLYAWATGQFARCFFNRWFPLAVGLALAVALPWYFMAYGANGDVFLQELYRHNFSRFTGGVAYHPEPWWYFIPVLAVGFLPWSIFLPTSLWDHLRQIKNHHGDKLAAGDPLYKTSLFGFIWAVFIFLFFTVATTKLLTYILPMFGGLALMTGATFYRAWGSGHYPSLKWLAAALFVLLAVAAPVFLWQPAMFLPKIAAEINAVMSDPATVAAVLTLLAGVLGLAIFLFRGRPGRALVAQGAAMALLAVLALHGLVPRINNVTQGAMMAFVEIARGEPLVIYEITRPSLTYYSRKKIPHVAYGDYDKLEALLHRQAHRRLFIIAKNSQLEKLRRITPPQATLSLVERRNIYSLLRLNLNEDAPKRPAKESDS